MTRPRITVVGSSNLDLVAKVPRFPNVGETLEGHSFYMGFGGKGANQAIMSARLGAHVTMVTKLGRDVFSEMTLKNYREQDVDTRFVLFGDERASGVASILVDEQGRNMIVIVPGANMALSPDDVRAAREVIQSANVVVCQLEVPVETTLETFRIAKEADVRTILNPAPAAPIPDELLELSDIVSPNETETELLTSMPVGTIEEAEAAARHLQGRGARTVVLTLGERGVLLVEEGSAVHVPAVQVEAVDTTGAGDAFIGSLAVFLAEGQSLPKAIEWANAVAAVSVTKIGTQASFPKREEVAHLLQ